MANSLYFNNNSVEYLLHEEDTPEYYDDFQRIIYEKLGRDAENIIVQLRKKADYTTQKVDTDLQSYEGSLESNTSAFQEILDLCESMKKDLDSKTRLNRQKLIEFVQEIQSIINIQI